MGRKTSIILKVFLAGVSFLTATAIFKNKNKKSIEYISVK